MKNLIVMLSTGLLAVAFPVMASAEDFSGISMGQQQQQQVSVDVDAINSVGISDGFDFGDCNFCAGGFDEDFGGFGGGVNQVVDVTTNVQQQQQQQIGNGSQSQQQQQSGNGQQQQQQQNQQVAQVETPVSPTPVTKTGELPSTGADAAVPGMLAFLGTSVVAYLKHKKRMVSLSFLK